VNDMHTCHMPQILHKDPSLMYRLWPRAADIVGTFSNAVHRPLYLELGEPYPSARKKSLTHAPLVEDSF
jgi:hypothetical protein